MNELREVPLKGFGIMDAPDYEARLRAAQAGAGAAPAGSERFEFFGPASLPYPWSLTTTGCGAHEWEPRPREHGGGYACTVPGCNVLVRPTDPQFAQLDAYLGGAR